MKFYIVQGIDMRQRFLEMAETLLRGPGLSPPPHMSPFPHATTPQVGTIVMCVGLARCLTGALCAMAAAALHVAGDGAGR
jgi:hypothetical protein